MSTDLATKIRPHRIAAPHMPSPTAEAGRSLRPRRLPCRPTAPFERSPRTKSNAGGKPPRCIVRRTEVQGFASAVRQNVASSPAHEYKHVALTEGLQRLDRFGCAGRCGFYVMILLIPGALILVPLLWWLLRRVRALELRRAADARVGGQNNEAGPPKLRVPPHSRRINLAPNQMFAANLPRDVGVRVLEGPIWATTSGSPEDIWLQAGDEHRVSSCARTVLQASDRPSIVELVPRVERIENLLGAAATLLRDIADVALAPFSSQWARRLPNCS
jgi:hypothetical protein